jgi:hypothetical protein
MVDFNKLRCRNCRHWHRDYNEITIICTTRIDGIFCGCDNWESCDNLKYLEQRYEKSLK